MLITRRSNSAIACALSLLLSPANVALGLGVSSHIVGTDWLTRRDARAGGLAALAFVMAGLVAAVVVPAIWGRV